MSNSEIGFGGLSDFEHIVDRGSLTSEQSQKIKRTNALISNQYPGSFPFLESALSRVRDGFNIMPPLSRFMRLIGANVLQDEAPGDSVFDVVGIVEAGNIADRSNPPFQDVFLTIWANKEVFVDEISQKAVCGLALSRLLIEYSQEERPPLYSSHMGLAVSRFTEVTYCHNNGVEQYIYGQQKEIVGLERALRGDVIDDGVRNGLSDADLGELLNDFHRSERMHRLVGGNLQLPGILSKILQSVAI